MRLLGFIAAGCIGLALLRTAIVAGVVLWGLLLLYALIRHPWELLGFLMLTGLFQLGSHSEWTAVFLFAVLALALVVGTMRSNSP